MNPLSTENASTAIGPAGAESPILYVVVGIMAIMAVAGLAYVAVRAVRTFRGG